MARLTSGTIWIRIRIHIRMSDPDCHRNLTICSLVHCQPSLKISCKSIWKFLRKVANRQRDRQTNDDGYISPSAEGTTQDTSWKAILPRNQAWLVVHFRNLLWPDVQPVESTDFIRSSSTNWCPRERTSIFLQWLANSDNQIIQPNNCGKNIIYVMNAATTKITPPSACNLFISRNKRTPFNRIITREWLLTLYKAVTVNDNLL